MVCIVPELLVILPPLASVRLLAPVVLMVKEFAPGLNVRLPIVADAAKLGERRLDAAVLKYTAAVVELGLTPLQFPAALQVLLAPPVHAESAAKAGIDNAAPAITAISRRKLREELVRIF
jgi:hypothetical protein